MQFPDALRNVASEARGLREITLREYLMVLSASFRSRVVIKAERHAASCALKAGYCTSDPMGSDWDELLDFLREFLPMLLEFLKDLMILF